jgi:hypothetical protein
VLNGEKVRLKDSRKFVGDSLTLGHQTWATNSGGWNFRGADLGCVVCRCTNPDIPESASPKDRIMVLLVTAADIEHGGEGVFEVLNHQQLAGHTASSGPHLKVCLFL